MAPSRRRTAAQAAADEGGGGAAASPVDDSLITSTPRRRAKQVARITGSPRTDEMGAASPLPDNADGMEDAETPRRRGLVRVLFSPNYRPDDTEQPSRPNGKAPVRRPLFADPPTPDESDGESQQASNENAMHVDLSSIETVADLTRVSCIGMDLDEELDCLYFIKSLPPLSDLLAPKPSLPPRTRSSARKTLVLDLDETLVHCSTVALPSPDHVFDVHVNGMSLTVYLRRRPFLEHFLERVAQLYEVVIFTASQRVYANRVLDLLDRDRRLIRHRLFRDSCAYVQGNYLKDLRVLGRELHSTLIVDNSPEAFGYHVANGVPIPSWFDDNDDRHLLLLLEFLEQVHAAEDVRPLIRDRFGLEARIAALPDMPPGAMSLPEL